MPRQALHRVTHRLGSGDIAPFRFPSRSRAAADSAAVPERQRPWTGERLPASAAVPGERLAARSRQSVAAAAGPAGPSCCGAGDGTGDRRADGDDDPSTANRRCRRSTVGASAPSRATTSDGAAEARRRACRLRHAANRREPFLRVKLEETGQPEPEHRAAVGRRSRPSTSPPWDSGDLPDDREARARSRADSGPARRGRSGRRSAAGRPRRSPARGRGRRPPCPLDADLDRVAPLGGVVEQVRHRPVEPVRRGAHQRGLPARSGTATPGACSAAPLDGARDQLGRAGRPRARAAASGSSSTRSPTSVDSSSTWPITSREELASLVGRQASCRRRAPRCSCAGWRAACAARARRRRPAGAAPSRDASSAAEHLVERRGEAAELVTRARRRSAGRGRASPSPPRRRSVRCADRPERRVPDEQAEGAREPDAAEADEEHVEADPVQRVVDLVERPGDLDARARRRPGRSRRGRGRPWTCPSAKNGRPPFWRDRLGLRRGPAA